MQAETPSSGSRAAAAADNSPAGPPTPDTLNTDSSRSSNSNGSSVQRTSSKAADQAQERGAIGDDVTSSSRDSAASADAGGGDGSRPEQQDVLTALQGLLGQHASSREDPAQAAFEHAVLAYVQGQYADAVQQLGEVKAAAVKAGQPSLAADACRWLGHAQAKRGDPVRAVAAFAEGAHLAQTSGSKKLQVGHMFELHQPPQDTNSMTSHRTLRACRHALPCPLPVVTWCH